MALSSRILVVDGEEKHLASITALLRSFGYRCEKARDGIEALAKMKLDVDLVLIAVKLPDMDGFELVQHIRNDMVYENVPILMMCDTAEKENCFRAIKAGAADFIIKPADEMELHVRLPVQLKMKQTQDMFMEHKTKMEEIVAKRTSDLSKALEDMAAARRSTQEAHIETIRRLSIAAEYKDDDTAAHIHRMSRYSAIIARGLDLPQSEVEIISHASLMHDVGKIGIPDSILFKPDGLNSSEWEIMRGHTSIGGRILQGSTSKVMRAGKIIAMSHHEKWDGSGYPDGLKGEQIPLWGRICCVADVYDALISNRPYKSAFSIDKALEIIKTDSGTHFDPQIIDIFVDNFDMVIQIRHENSQAEVAV
jgi:putative two-component system response regulator